MSEPLKTQTPNYVWNGIYRNWSLASEAVKKLGHDGGLKGDIWLNRITQQLLDYRRELRQYGIAMPPRPCNLPLVCAIANPRKILDFGGSSGWCWDYLMNSVASKDVELYTVVETEDVVNYMISSRLQCSPVEYKTIDRCIGDYDLLYCNSVLQYFESNASLISLAKRVSPTYIFLEELMGKGDDDFYTIQKFYNSGMPYRFIGLSKLLRELSLEGYCEIVRYPYPSPVLGLIKPFEMSNFPDKMQIRYAVSILLKKIDKKC